MRLRDDLIVVLIAVMILPPAPGATIQDLLPKVHSRIAAQARPVSVTEDFRARLTEVALSIHAGGVQDERQRLSTLDATVQSRFAAIETKLQAAGLVSKLDDWHAFVSRYRSRMANARTQLDGLANLAPSAGRKEFDDRLAAFQSSLVAESPRLTTIASPKTELSSYARMNAPPIALIRRADTTPTSDTPTLDDLAETKTILLSPDIRAKAAAEGNSPAALFAFVYNNTEFEPYYGLMQNSEAVLWSKRGNDADQSTLLIALLRAAGIPARYVVGYLTIPVADAVNWTGAKDAAGAKLLLRLSTQFQDNGATYSIAHTWVEAYFDNGNGPAWAAMTPSIKRRNILPSIQMAAPVFDRGQFVLTVKNVLATETYEEQIRAAFEKAYPGHGFNELTYGGPIIPADPSTLPAFPYVPDSILYKEAQRGAANAPTVAISLVDLTTNAVYVTKSFSLPEVCLQSITLSFGAATAADKRVLDLFGGVQSAPAALVNMAPQIRLDGAVAASGSTGLPTGQSVGLQVAYTRAGGTTPFFSYTHNVHVGETAAIGLHANEVSEQLTTSRMTKLLASLPTASSDDATRELLNIAAMRYYQRCQIERRRIGDPLQWRFLAPVVEECATIATLDTQTLFSEPFFVTPGHLIIDAKGVQGLYLDMNSPNATTDADRLAYWSLGYAGSALEHELWEELVQIPSISTVKGLQLASQKGTQLLTIGPGATQGLVTLLNNGIPHGLIEVLVNEIAAGDTVTIPASPVTYLNWTGTVWIDDGPTGTAYEITAFAPAIKGGDTGGNNVTPPPLPNSSGDATVNNCTECGDPVTVSSGNFFSQASDLSYTSRGMPVVFTRTYNSMSANNDGPFGFGWTHSYRTALKDNQSSITLADGSGAAWVFSLTGSTYSSPPGRDLSLTKDAQGYTVRTKEGLQYRFDTRGLLQSTTDRNQNAVSFAYDANNRLVRVTDTLGRALTLTYNGQGHVTGIQDFSGRQVSYQYDVNANLASVTDAAGKSTTYTYYGDRILNHLMQTLTDPNGNKSSYAYYSNQKLQQSVDPGGQVMSYMYMPMRNETLVTDSRGLTYEYHYNALGNVTQVVKADGNYVDTVYTADAKLASRTDEAGNVTTQTYDNLGNMTSTTSALGHTYKLTYDPTYSLVTSMTDPLGNVTKLTYDTHGNLVDLQRPLGVEFKFTYNSFGDLLTGTDGEGNTTTLSYDSSGNPIQVTDPMGNVTKLSFDTLRRVTSLTDPLSNQTGLQYDSLSRVTQIKDKLGNPASIAYDAKSNVSRIADFNGSTSSYSYDALDHLAQVNDPLTNVTQFGYTNTDAGFQAGSNLTNVVDAAGQSHGYTYDENDMLTKAAGPAAASLTYDPRGLLASKTDANGNTIRFERDADGRLLRKVFPDGTDARFSYDANGNLTSAANAYTTIAYTYDALNRLSGETDSRFNKTVRYTYNRSGVRTTRTDSEGGITAYTYDKNSRLTSVTAPGGGKFQFTYDSLNRRSTIVASTGSTTGYQYDAQDRVSALGASSYSYDRNGNLVTATDSAGSHNFQYDAANRLTGANHPTLPAESYSYDGAGNRTASATSANYAYDGSGRLASAEGLTYTYNNNGNLTSRSGSSGATNYSYDFENQLVGISFPDGTSAAYKYDALGRRIEKNVNGAVTAYLYDGTNLLLETDGTGAIQARYVQGAGMDEPLVMERGGQSYFYQADRAGSITQVTDSSGNQVCSYSYDSFGNTQGCQSVTNPFSFVGREFDSESGLYYMRGRYYDPQVGRFITPDPLDVTGGLLAAQGNANELFPIAPASLLDGLGAGRQYVPQSLNAYSYALNNPYAYSDPSGLFPCPWVLAKELAALRAIQAVQPLTAVQWFRMMELPGLITASQTAYAAIGDAIATAALYAAGAVVAVAAVALIVYGIVYGVGKLYQWINEASWQHARGSEPWQPAIPKMSPGRL